MPNFDYCSDAELYTNKSKWLRRGSVGYKRFSRANDAIRFAIEGLPEASLIGAWLGVGEDRFSGLDVRLLYEDEAYSLDRAEPRIERAPARSTFQLDSASATRRPLWWSRQ